MKPILLTGAGGFVGRCLSQQLAERGHPLRAATTRLGASGGEAWARELGGCDAVLHLAARVHVMDERASDPLAAFREVNTAGTLALARQAAAAGVRRFVFVSSIKVNGEQTAPGRAFRHDDRPAPQDAYGRSKYEAEDGLRALSRATGMELVIVRPPLVHGPGVKANFAALMRAVQRGLPLPLGAVTGNRRSLVGLDNLVDLLITCVEHPGAAGQTFLASDGEDLSTTELLRRIGQALGRPALLLPVPPALLQAGATLLGRREVAQRLLGNLQLDITHTRTTLGWTPPISVDEGLRRAATALKSP